MKVVLQVSLGAIFLWAAISKAVDASATRAVLAHLLPSEFVTRESGAVLVSLLAAYEAALGIAVIGAGRSRTTLLLVLGTLVVYSLVLVRLVLDDRAPGCGCLGFPRFFGSSSPETWGGLVRNLGMIGCAVVLLAESGQSRKVAGRRVIQARSSEARARSAPAFTLIELLVCIAVIALLVGLSLPALRAARYESRVTAACCTVRQIGTACMLYADANRDFLPYLGAPGQPDAALVVNGNVLNSSLYFQQSRYFVNLLHPEYYSDRVSLDRPFGYGIPVPDGVIVSRYDVTNCAFAAPRYWIGNSAPADPTLYRGQRLIDAAFPARKGLLLDLATGVIAPDAPVRYPGPITVGLVDGSAGQRRYDDSCDERIVTRPYGNTPWPVMATRGGFDGWDFE